VTGLARRLAAALCVLLACAVSPARADEFRPAYLQLTEIAPGEYDVLWKLPALDESTPLKLRPVFPERTEVTGAVRATFAAGTTVQRWRIRVEGGLAGRSIAFPDLATVPIDVLVRVVHADGAEQLGRASRSAPSLAVAGRPGPWEVARSYTVLGVEHILGGIDHLLFVLALLLLVDGVRRLVATITAFTVAHSITLGGAALGVVALPGPPVEAAIALSIVFVAAEILKARDGVPTITQRRPWVVAFTFGLLHGLGFASALAEVGLPTGSIPLALVCFNIGVELGQLAFVAATLLAIRAGRWASRRLGLSAPAWIGRVPPYAIGGVASFWAIQRIAAF
jgi:hydrogenase/urease accessory protein HupE